MVLQVHYPSKTATPQCSPTEEIVRKLAFLGIFHKQWYCEGREKRGSMHTLVDMDNLRQGHMSYSNLQFLMLAGDLFKKCIY